MALHFARKRIRESRAKAVAIALNTGAVGRDRRARRTRVLNTSAYRFAQRSGYRSVDWIIPSPKLTAQMKRQRVLLGMSGGVDSSVAGYLLREGGYEVIGVTMKVWPQDCISRAEDKCCGPQAVADARSVAHSLGISHYVVDEADQFEQTVIAYFASEYQAGRTPNPCVMCNEKLKFGNLWGKAQALGCDYIATGHYAIIEHHADRAILRKGVDPRKDQSYFLFSLRQPQLRRALAPLGTMTKSQIREIAHTLGLKVADKIDSQEICFVPGNDYKAFLRSHLGEKQFHRGEIYDVHGNFIAERHPAVLQSRDGPGQPLEATVKIRYNHPGTPANVTPLENNRARIRLHEAQRAVTPGQAAVIYDGDLVLGGGWICRTEPVRRIDAPSRLAAPVLA